MVKRLKFATNEWVSFLRGPATHLKNSENTYNQLLDIASLAIIIITIPIVVNPAGGAEIFVSLIVVILFSRLGAWLLIHFYGVVFDLFIEKIVFARYLDRQSKTELNRKIIVYASISSLINILPFQYIWIAGAIISIYLTGLGLKVLYDLKDSQALISATVFVASWLMIWQLITLIISNAFTST